MDMKALITGNELIGGDSEKQPYHLPHVDPTYEELELRFQKTSRYKIRDDELINHLQAGWKVQDIATKFHMAVQSVYDRIHKLGYKAQKYLLIDNRAFSKSTRSPLRTLEQIVYMNDRCLKELDKISDKKNNIRNVKNYNSLTKLELDVMKRIEKQNQMQSDILKLLFSIEQVLVFQEAVLETIEEVSPEAKKDIVRKLRAKQELSALLRTKKV